MRNITLLTENLRLRHTLFSKIRILNRTQRTFHKSNEIELSSSSLLSSIQLNLIKFNRTFIQISQHINPFNYYSTAQHSTGQSLTKPNPQPHAPYPLPHASEPACVAYVGECIPSPLQSLTDTCLLSTRFRLAFEQSATKKKKKKSKSKKREKAVAHCAGT